MAMLSIWGIILVVMGHSGFTSSIIAEPLRHLHIWIYSFHMPLFFFISGYLYSLTNKNFDRIEPRTFMKKKWDRLMVPYLVLGVIVFAIKYIFSGLSSVERTFSVESFLYMFVTPTDENSTMGFLWYLITLFLIFIVVTGLRLTGLNLKRMPGAIICLVTSWVLFYILPQIEIFNLTGILWNLPFFIGGIMTQTTILKPRRTTESRTKYQMGGGIQLIVSLLLFFIGGIFCFSIIGLPSIISRIVAALAGITASAFLCQALINKKWIDKKILPFATDTYTIYLLSWFGQYPVQIACLNILHLNWIASFLLIFIAGLILPIIVHRLIQRNPCLHSYKLLRLSIGY